MIVNEGLEHIIPCEYLLVGTPDGVIIVALLLTTPCAVLFGEATVVLAKTLAGQRVCASTGDPSETQTCPAASPQRILSPAEFPLDTCRVNRFGVIVRSIIFMHNRRPTRPDSGENKPRKPIVTQAHLQAAL